MRDVAKKPPMARVNKVICTVLLAVLILNLEQSTLQAQERPERSWRFGVIESYESPSHADRLNVGWTRIIFHWAEVQAGGVDSWSPSVNANLIDTEIEAGRMVVGLLIGIPNWAMDESGLPQGLWAPPNDPSNTWARYVEMVVSRYREKIDHWIIWNEPDILEDAIAHSWNGTVSDFVQLQRIAYKVAKAANPEAIIHLPAFTYWSDYQAGSEQYMARLLDEIQEDPQAAANNHYFDVATAHLYFQPGQIYDLLTHFTDIMRVRGLQQPIWLVETNAPPIDDPQWPVSNWTLSVTQQEQAAFMPQAMALALAAGAERVGLYKLKDTDDDNKANPEPFGLVRMDSSERPAFATYRLAVGYLSGTFRAERERWDDIGQIRLEQEGQTTTLLFSRLPEWKTARVTATGDQARLVDMWGTTKVVTPTNGMYTVNLQPASCSHSIGDYCMIGGPDYYLIQSANIVRPTMTQTPSMTPASTPTHTPSTTATTASTATPTQTPLATRTIKLTTSLEPTPPPNQSSTPVAGFSPTASTQDRTNETQNSSSKNPPGPESGATPGLRPYSNDVLTTMLVGGGVILVLILGVILRIRSRS